MDEEKGSFVVGSKEIGSDNGGDIVDGHFVDCLVFDDLVEERKQSVDEETIWKRQSVHEDLEILDPDGLILDGVLCLISVSKKQQEASKREEKKRENEPKRAIKVS